MELTWLRPSGYKMETKPKCATCPKTDNLKHVSIGIAGVGFNGHLCKECYEKVTLGQLLKMSAK